MDLVVVDPGGVEVAADWDSLWSPENYPAAARTGALPPLPMVRCLTPRRCAVLGRLRLNQWALSGD